MLPIFRCSSKERHFFLFSSENVDVRKSQKWWFWRWFTCLFCGKIFGYRFFCSKSSEWTTTSIDNISIHNHGTPAYMNLTWIYITGWWKISFSRTSSLNFVRHFENSMRYHCFIPWWAPVSWDMTLMKPCVCAPRKLERSFLGWKDLQFGSLYFTTWTLLGFLSRWWWIFFLQMEVVDGVVDSRFSWEKRREYMWEQRWMKRLRVFFSDLWFLRVWQHLETGLDTHKVTRNVGHIATCSSEGWDVSATSVQPTEAFRYLYL